MPDAGSYRGDGYRDHLSGVPSAADGDNELEVGCDILVLSAMVDPTIPSLFIGASATADCYTTVNSILF